jgi:hypothetical protein
MSRVRGEREAPALLDDNFQAAFRMMTIGSGPRGVRPDAKESIEVRERYGMNRFGQCCLLARRLVEAGCGS